MKSLFRLSALLMLLCFMGCSDDEGISYPTSNAPEIKVLRDELYSNPNRKFVIKADLKDDLGLKSLKIVIPEFYLDKEIVFPTDTLVTEYELAYEFLAPKDTKNEDVYKVNLALEDVSGNVVTKELTLHLDGDFNAPNFSNVSPQDGTVQLLESKMELSLSFKVTDDSGLDSVYVEEPILGIMERIKLNGEKEYSFSPFNLILSMIPNIGSSTYTESKPESSVTLKESDNSILLSNSCTVPSCGDTFEKLGALKSPSKCNVSSLVTTFPETSSSARFTLYTSSFFVSFGARNS